MPKSRPRVIGARALSARAKRHNALFSSDTLRAAELFELQS
jgi:hypothetical protein